MTDISVLTVTFQSRDLVGIALGSARKAARRAGLSLELVVVDNASTDGSADAVAAAFPEAQLVRNATNDGFGAATNHAITRAGGSFWLLMNPDAVLAPEALGILVAFLRTHPEAAAAAPSLQGVDPEVPEGAESAGMTPGLRSLAGHFLLLNRFLPGDHGGAWRGFQLRRVPGRRPRRVEWASAAVLLVRPEAMRQVGGFDERFFMYGEDVDLGARLTAAGWETWLLPEARAGHLIAASSGGVNSGWVDGIHRLAAERSGRLRLVTFDALVLAGLLVRVLGASLAPDMERPTRRLHARRMRTSAMRASQLLLESIRGRR